MYYQGILAAKPSSQNLEEFLVAAGRKEQIHFTISETDCRFDALTESQQQKIEIKKSEWGYLELAITSDAAFVQPAQTQITSEDFLGSTFVLKYIVDYDRMHAGNNYAKITFSSVYETKVLEIYAHKGEKQKSKEQKEHAKIRECQSGLAPSKTGVAVTSQILCISITLNKRKLTILNLKYPSATILQFLSSVKP